MSDKKNFLMLGLGRFGGTLATKLTENGNDVTGLDINREVAEKFKDILYETVIADATDEKTLEEIGIEKYDAVFISLSDSDITPSMLTTLHAKDFGAKRVIVKGISHDHKRLLESLKVDKVIFPEVDVAMQLADRMTWPNILDFVPLGSEYSFVEIAVPDCWQGKTLTELDLRAQYEVTVVGVKEALSGYMNLFPTPTFKFGPGQMLMAVGKQDGINALRELK